MGVWRAGNRWWLVLVTVVVAAVVVAVIIVTGRVTGRGDEARQADAGSPATAPVGADTLPPWAAPSDATAAARNAGLPMLGSEGMVEHIHAHLDVLADGKPVPVPADIGIDATRHTISPLHTHDDSGVIHIESAVQRQFSLGEFFTEWGVSLSGNNIGGLRSTAGKTVRAYVNGQPHAGDPAAIVLNQHDEIALVYGPPQPGETVPSRYPFPPGD